MNEDSTSEKRLLTITYRFRFEQQKEKEFTVRLDWETLDILHEPGDPLPEWTELSFHQCPNCPLEESLNKSCPIAVSLIDLIDFFKDFISYDEVNVWVETEERTYSKRTSLQTAAGSLMGIYMVSSGCPILNKMRPMVLTHLPFQSWEETSYRFITMYLFVQHILFRGGREPDWELKKFADFYQEVELVNQGFAKRLNAIQLPQGDVSLNAINFLHSTGSMAGMTIEVDGLEYWNKIIMAHWDE
ncbi:MAG: hypothetical protein JSU92_05565 [Deltaproteobacteria bacterium]|nr:MAG: hypothetical protein JSU92_05565 [Deltaproteobacteria bacterium]